MANDTVIIVQGDEELSVALERTAVNLVRLRRQLPAWLADRSDSFIRIYAPGGAIGGIAQATSHTETFYHPGGAGGGGSYEAQAGVTAVPTIHGPSLYPLYVHEGTANKGRGYIYARDDRSPASVLATGRPRRQTDGVIAFMYRGEKIFRHRIQGQKPNPYVQHAFRQTALYARMRVHTLGREIVAGHQPTS